MQAELSTSDGRGAPTVEYRGSSVGTWIQVRPVPGRSGDTDYYSIQISDFFTMPLDDAKKFFKACHNAVKDL